MCFADVDKSVILLLLSLMASSLTRNILEWLKVLVRFNQFFSHSIKSSCFTTRPEYINEFWFLNNFTILSTNGVYNFIHIGLVKKKRRRRQSSKNKRYSGLVIERLL